MATICPTVTAENPHQYREQIERVAPFVTHIHLDFTDGSLTDSVTPALHQAWWPHSMQADLHIMYKQPAKHLEAILALNPRMVIVQAEADLDMDTWASSLHAAGIQVGVALLPETETTIIQPYLAALDHVLIFSGHLGHFGGQANLDLLEKVSVVKAMRSDLTVGWDGGINADNIAQLVKGGVDVLNVGGFIQRAEDPQAAYAELTKQLERA